MSDIQSWLEKRITLGDTKSSELDALADRDQAQDMRHDLCHPKVCVASVQTGAGR